MHLRARFLISEGKPRTDHSPFGMGELPSGPSAQKNVAVLGGIRRSLDFPHHPSTLRMSRWLRPAAQNLHLVTPSHNLRSCGGAWRCSSLDITFVYLMNHHLL